jgi:tetratricopeptide (TPR) repeat protein
LITRLAQLRVGRVSALVLILSAGCASRPSTSLMDRLVTRGRPTSDVSSTFDVPASADAPGVVSAGGVERPELAVRPRVAPGVTLELEDEVLRRELSRLAVRESAAAHRAVAGAYLRARVYDRAEYHLSQALRLSPRDPDLLETRARVWRDAGVLDRALSDAHRAVFLAPARPEPHNTLGTVLFAMGQFESARERFARALALAPEAAYARTNLCLARVAAGEHEIDPAVCPRMETP